MQSIDSRGPRTTPFFGIGVTTYDRMTMLLECLASISSQSFGDFEVLVGNDNTRREVTAESVGITDPRFRFINHPQNLGEMGNMNHMMYESRATYFTWLADDDLFLPEALRTMYEVIQEEGQPECVFSSYLQGETYSGERGSGRQKANSMSGEEFLSNYLTGNLRLQGCYGFFRRDVVIQLGGMQRLGSGASPYGDVILAIRSGGLRKVYYLPTEIVFYRTHAGSSTLTSPDLEAFSSSERGLLRESNVVFTSESLRHRKPEFLYLLVDRVRRDYFEVLRRSGHVRFRDIMGYCRIILPYVYVCRAHWKALMKDSISIIAGVIIDLHRAWTLDIPFRILRFFRFRKQK